jgi:two-component system NtrC family sensor kinase
VQRDLNVIIEETGRVRRIVRELLDFARQAPAVKENIDLNAVLKNLVALIVKQREFRTIRFEEQYDDNPEDFYADKNQIQQLFLNLLMNSAESIPGEGSITIVTRRMKNQCIVTISDTGCGIREEDLPKIYDPFFTTKPAGKGTGLGLSVSYGIVRQYGGEIRCESKEGKGTTFTVVLPCQKGNESPDAQPAGS